VSGQRKLTRNVIVQAPPGTSVPFAVYGPESEDIPDWAMEQMGDHCFEDVPGQPDPDAQLAEQSQAAAANEDGPGGEPPRAGRGSGLEAWTDYAVGLGIDVPDDASRDDVIELVDAYNAQA
jgi:hypothetical protein